MGRRWERRPPRAMAGGATGLGPGPSYLLQAAGRTHLALRPGLPGRLRGPSLALQQC